MRTRSPERRGEREGFSPGSRSTAGRRQRSTSPGRKTGRPEAVSDTGGSQLTAMVGDGRREGGVPKSRADRSWRSLSRFRVFLFKKKNLNALKLSYFIEISIKISILSKIPPYF